MKERKRFFVSKYKKMLNDIKNAKENKQRLRLDNDVVLDFREEPWTKVYRSGFGYAHSFRAEEGKYYLITRRLPTGNRKMELIKCDGKRLYVPEFTIAVMEVNADVYID